MTYGTLPSFADYFRNPPPPAPPAFDGLEIDMLSLGDADSILATRWSAGIPTRILIDGGERGSYPEVSDFLLNRGVSHLDHVVCTHIHRDHAGGLSLLIKDRRFTFGSAWFSNPLWHISEYDIVESTNYVGGDYCEDLIESLNHIQGVESACRAKGIPIYEPFYTKERTTIGFLTICGPSREQYLGLVGDFADVERLERRAKARREAAKAQELLELYESVSGICESATLDSSPDTDADNESSVILAGGYNGHSVLFTGDAGKKSLALATQRYKLENLGWMQIPHHGSWRNITTGLINIFKPQTAFVSAGGCSKHPRKCVVNAFKKAKTEVYSTHYPNGGHLWHHNGLIPDRRDYGSATSLWNNT